MKIERHIIPRCTIDAFADKHNLCMEVHQRTIKDSPTKYYAAFKYAETQLNGRFLCSEFGNGATQREAIREYAKAISGKLLVIDAMSHSARREIIVPQLSSA